MKCCVLVERGASRVSGVGNYSPCTRKATVRAGGKWYCRQHSPSAVKAREREHQELVDIKWHNKMNRRFR